MKYTFTLVAAVLALAFANISNAQAEEPKSETAVGFIRNVDLSTGTFVLGGKNESQTTFKIGVMNGEKRGDCLLLVDGKQAKADALKNGSKATVTYVKVGDELSASKIEIESKKPAGGF